MPFFKDIKFHNVQDTLYFDYSVIANCCTNFVGSISYYGYEVIIEEEDVELLIIVRCLLNKERVIVIIKIGTQQKKFKLNVFKAALSDFDKRRLENSVNRYEIKKSALQVVSELFPGYQIYLLPVFVMMTII